MTVFHNCSCETDKIKVGNRADVFIVTQEATVLLLCLDCLSVCTIFPSHVRELKSRLEKILFIVLLLLVSFASGSALRISPFCELSHTRVYWVSRCSTQV